MFRGSISALTCEQWTHTGCSLLNWCNSGREVDRGISIVKRAVCGKRPSILAALALLPLQEGLSGKAGDTDMRS